VKWISLYLRARRGSPVAVRSQPRIDPGSEGGKIVDDGRPRPELPSSAPTDEGRYRHPALAYGAMLAAAVVAVFAVATALNLTGGARTNAKASIFMARAQLTAAPGVSDRSTSPSVGARATSPTSPTTAAPPPTTTPTTTAASIRSAAATTAAPPKVVVTTAVAVTTADECSVALTYLAAHAKPGFAHYCRPRPLTVGISQAVAYTCVPGTRFTCPDGVPEIIIADPACPISYENEASNSYWNFSSGAVISPGAVQSGRTWDPYGECP
jgi:hypothetical protein